MWLGIYPFPLELNIFVNIINTVVIFTCYEMHVYNWTYLDFINLLQNKQTLLIAYFKWFKYSAFA